MTATLVPALQKPSDIVKIGSVSGAVTGTLVMAIPAGIYKSLICVLKTVVQATGGITLEINAAVRGTGQHFYTFLGTTAAGADASDTYISIADGAHIQKIIAEISISNYTDTDKTVVSIVGGDTTTQHNSGIFATNAEITSITLRKENGTTFAATDHMDVYGVK